MACASPLPRLLKVEWVGKPLTYSLLPSHQIGLHIAVVHLALPLVSRVIPVAPTSRLVHHTTVLCSPVNQGPTIFVYYCPCLPTYHCLPGSTILFLALRHLTRYVYFTFANIKTNQIFKVRLVPMCRRQEGARQWMRLWRRRLAAQYSGS